MFAISALGKKATLSCFLNITEPFSIEYYIHTVTVRPTIFSLN